MSENGTTGIGQRRKALATVIPKLSESRRVVVKTGSNLVAENGVARREWLANLAEDFAIMKARKQEVVLVSSGAISLGKKYLSSKPLKNLEEKQAAAALGQPLLMKEISEAFSAHQIRVAQSLLTLDDTEVRRRWLNARSTLNTLLTADTVPVINENDTVATDEIRYGDNDRLAARVAQMIGAETLVLLSDVDGMYTDDPRKNPRAELIRRLDKITIEHERMAGKANTGSGGMDTKLQAAQIAYSAGCKTVISLGDKKSPLISLDGEGSATWIVPSHSAEMARAIWLKSHLKPEGSIIIDEGAKIALSNGASLLPVGVSSVEGHFDRGAAVFVKDQTRNTVAKGIVSYASRDLALIKGLQTDEVEPILGFRGRPAVIHRDDMVLESKQDV